MKKLFRIPIQITGEEFSSLKYQKSSVRVTRKDGLESSHLRNRFDEPDHELKISSGTTYNERISIRLTRMGIQT